MARILAFLRARLAAGPRGGLPVATWFGHALVTAFFCGLVSDFLPPFAYGLFALSLLGALLAIPLLGELGWLLRQDAGEEWAATLPIRPIERRIARTLHLLLLLFGLALASLLPATWLLPSATSLGARLAFPLCGLAFAACLAAALLLLQSLLAGRAEGLLVLVQTLLVVAVVVGLVVGVRHVPLLARTPHLGDAGGGFLWLVPQAWCAAPLAGVEGEPTRAWLPALAGLGALACLALLPPASAPRSGRGEPLLARLLRPLRALATRWWVRPEERAAFDLVYDALPREREVVLRTYPMIGIPLAFLATAALGDPRTGAAGPSGPGADAAREGLLALLFFTAGIYLPVLLTQIPASSSAAARWIQECAPVREGALACGAIKAVAVRFLLPLYAVLGWIAWLQAGPSFVLTVGLPGALSSLLVCQLLYPVCVRERPLSVAPDELRADLDWLGVLGVLALVLTLLSVAVQRFLPVWGLTLLVAGELWASAVAFRRMRTGLVPASR